MRTGAASAIGTRRHNENDLIRRTGVASAVSAVGTTHHNENDVTVIIAGRSRDVPDIRFQWAGYPAIFCYPVPVLDPAKILPVDG